MYHNGLHIAISGVDGAGKSTQAGYLFKKISDYGYCTYLCENNDVFSFFNLKNLAYKANEKDIRKYAGVDNSEILMTMDSIRDYQKDILPTKNSGNIVVVPRSNFDRLAKAELYNCENINLLYNLHNLCDDADIHFFLTLPPETAVERVKQRGMDEESIEILNRYNKLLEKQAKNRNWIFIDSNQSKEKVHNQIWDYVKAYLDKHNPLT